jgi:hypothetical protein
MSPGSANRPVTPSSITSVIPPARQPGKPPAVYVGNHLALVRVLDRFLMYVDTRAPSVTPHFLMGGAWKPGVTRLFTALLKPAMTVVDIGVNFGYFTLMSAATAGPQGMAYSLEADPRNFEILTQNVAVNWWGDRVLARHCAVMDSRRHLVFYKTTQFLGCGSFYVEKP